MKEFDVVARAIQDDWHLDSMGWEPALTALDTIESRLAELEAEVKWLRTFMETIDVAHQEQRRTGDYVALGIAARDALWDAENLSARTLAMRPIDIRRKG